MCCMSSDVKHQMVMNRMIDKQLMDDKKKINVKILLLGAGESGKSTVAKQMKIIHLDGFKDEERASFKPIIFKNIIYSMRILVKKTTEYNQLEGKGAIEPKNQGFGARVIDKTDDHFGGPDPAIMPDDAKVISSLWNDPAIGATFERQSEYQLNDSASYFFEAVDRIAQPNYVPTDQDILRARVRTSGIIEINFVLKEENFYFSVIDVGGQRSERRKWIHCFQDVTAVLYCVDLSGYDRKLFEDETVNRMHESLQLFKDIVNGDWFSGTAMILFLNKRDIFQEKIKRVPLKICFEDYDGENNYDQASDFIAKRFKEQSKAKKEIFMHLTCATDTDNIKFVFAAVKKIILNRILIGTGVIM